MEVLLFLKQLLLLVEKHIDVVIERNSCIKLPEIFLERNSINFQHFTLLLHLLNSHIPAWSLLLLFQLDLLLQEVSFLVVAQGAESFWNQKIDILIGFFFLFFDVSLDVQDLELNVYKLFFSLLIVFIVLGLNLFQFFLRVLSIFFICLPSFLFSTMNYILP